MMIIIKSKIGSIRTKSIRTKRIRDSFSDILSYIIRMKAICYEIIIALLLSELLLGIVTLNAYAYSYSDARKFGIHNSGALNPPFMKPGDLGEPRSSYLLGSANNIQGKSVIISVFVDTPSNKWDSESKSKCLSELEGACEYISNEVKAYNSSSEFVFDWEQNPKLCYQARILKNPNENGFEDYLDGHIDRWVRYLLNTHFENSHNDHFLTGYDRFRNEYKADNVFLIAFFNTDGRAYAICYDGIDSPNESLVGYKNSTRAVLAHEILHLYGAHDFYEGAEYTKDAVEYIMNKYPDDIMLSATVNNNKVSETIGNLTAYHLGLIESVEGTELFPQILRNGD